MNANTWTALGPAPVVNGQIPGNGPVSGRIVGIAASPTDANTIFVASSGGGVWKTNDGGSNWVPLTDDQATLHMGAIAMSSDGSVIYAGTGETNAAGDSYAGAGILKSMDGGSTWSLIGTSQFGRRGITKIAVDPNNGNIVYVAVGDTPVNGLVGNQGIWKSSDGGQTWANMTSAVSNNVGFTDVVLDPNVPATVYAAIGGASASSGMYKSTNGGQTWARAGNFPSGTSDGRISVAISKSNPNVLYASISNPLTGGLRSVQKSQDGGATWRALNGIPNYMGQQGDYDQTIAISPTDQNVVFLGGAFGTNSVLETTDGGTTWVDISNTNGNNGPHADHHAMTFDAAGKLLDGNDGGIWRLTNPSTSGPVWANLNGNLNTIQFVGIAIDPSNANIAYGGTQDNGTNKFNDNLGWNHIRDGDGGFVRVDQTNPSTIYHTYFGNSLEKSTDGGQTWSSIAPFQANFDASNFYIPYILDPSNQSRILYGTDHIYESTNGGQSWKAFATPGQLGFNPIGYPVDNIAVAPTNSSVVYASAGGSIFVTTDGGVTWVDRTIPAGADTIPQIYVDPSTPTTAFAVRGAYNSSSNTGHVFMTTNAGASWTDISGNLPDLPSFSFTEQVTATATKLFVGTDAGVYYSTDTGASWAKYKSGMPNVMVNTLEYNSNLQILAAGTYGRGLWEISTNDPLVVKGVGPLTAVVGSVSFSGKTLTTFTDTPADPVGTYVATIDWGDGNSSPGTIAKNGSNYTVTGTHTYNLYGTYSMRVTVSNSRGSTTTVVNPVTVNDAPITGVPKTINIPEGNLIGTPVAEFNANNAAALPTQFTATIRWGDNFTSPGTIVQLSPGYFGVQGSHVYRQAGTYIPTITVVSRGGSKATIKSTVNVSDSPIDASPVTANAIEAIQFNGKVATYFDQAPDGGQVGDWLATIDWGDSTSTSKGIIAASGSLGNFDVQGLHSYSRFGTYSVTVSLQSSAGGPITQVVSTMNVTEAPVTGTAGTISATVGTPYSGVLATYVDANTAKPASDFTADIDWGDGTTGIGTVTLVSPGNFAVSGTHTFTNAGNPAVKVALHSAGGSVIPVQDVATTVVDAPLTPVFNGIAVGPADNPAGSKPGLTVTLGQTFSGNLASFTSTDPSAKPDEFTVVITWGDGSTSPGTVVAGTPPTTGSAFLIQGSHQYVAAGSYFLGVAITSKGGAVTNLSGGAQVLLPLTATLSPASDTGISNSDRITSANQLTYSGTGVFNATIVLYARPSDGSVAAFVIGQGTVDALGNWSITTTTPLSDGVYLLGAQTKDVDGNVIQTQDFGAASLLTIDHSGPQVTSMTVDAAKASALIVFSDGTGSGVVPAGLLNPANYSLGQNTKKGTTNIAVASVVPVTTSDGTQAVRVQFKTRGRLANGAYVIRINSNGITDVAGNAVYERTFVTFPQLSNTPVNTYIAQINVAKGVASGPLPYVPPREIIAAQTYSGQVRNPVPGPTVKIRTRRG